MKKNILGGWICQICQLNFWTCSLHVHGSDLKQGFWLGLLLTKEFLSAQDCNQDFWACILEIRNLAQGGPADQLLGFVG